MRCISDQRNGQVAEAYRTGERIVLSYLVCDTGGASLRECRDHPDIPLVNTIPFPDVAPTASVAFKVARPDPAGARVYVHLESPELRQAVPFESFRITDDTGLAGDTTEVHPGTFEQFLVNVDSGPQPTATLSYTTSLRRITLAGLFTERPSGAVQDLGDCVNDRPWEGYPKGFWKVTHIGASYSNRDGLYQVTVSVDSWRRRNWMSLWVGRKPDGNHVTIPPATLTTLRSNATGSGYVYAIAYNAHGVLQTGLYPLANFGAAIGEP